MPELPEVEVVKKSLEEEIINLYVKDVRIKDGNLRYKVSLKKINTIKGLKLLKIKRRSKYLLFFFNKIIMIVHLGMTGKFFIEKKKNFKKKTSFYYDLNDSEIKGLHDRVIFVFNNGHKLIYNDIRKFGFIKFESLNSYSNNSHLKILGPEPFDKTYNLSYFKGYIKGKNQMIKNLLMDQKFVSGLGNIYANEILYLSKIKPQKRIKKLKEAEIKKIIKFTKKVLKKAIILGGSSIKNFANSQGKKGTFQSNFKVYGRKGYKCYSSYCSGVVKKIVLGNRSSFFCPICQK